MGRRRTAWQCEKCQYVFSSRARYRNHRRADDCFKRGDDLRYHCPHEECDITFSRKDVAQRHARRVHAEKRDRERGLDDDVEAYGEVERLFACESCDHIANSIGEARQHRQQHINNILDAEQRGILFGGGKEEVSDAESEMSKPPLNSVMGSFKLIDKAFGRTVTKYRHIFKDAIHFADAAYAVALPLLVEFLRAKLTEHKGFLRAQLTITTEMMKLSGEADITDMTAMFFHTHMTPVTKDNAVEVVVEWLQEIEEKLDSMVHRGSGWVVSKVETMDVTVARGVPIKGACHTHELQKNRKNNLVPFMSLDTSCFKEQSWTLEDEVGGERENVLLDRTIATDPRANNCFYLALAKALAPATCTTEEDFARFATTFPYANSKLERALQQFWPHPQPFEVPLHHVEIIERKINIDRREKGEPLLAIHILYRNEEDELFPLRSSDVFRKKVVEHFDSELEKQKRTKPLLPKAVVLLFTYLRSKEMEKGHYVLIENPHRVLAPRETNTEGTITKTRRSGMYCLNCFIYIHSPSAYYNHVGWCYQKTGQQAKMPQENDTIEFSHGGPEEFLSPFFIVFDFEAYGRPLTNLDTNEACSCSVEAVREADRSRSEEEKVQEMCNLLDGAVRRSQLPKRCQHKIRALNRQEPMAVAMICVDRLGDVRDKFAYVGEDSVEIFLNKLLNWQKYYLGLLSPEKAKPMNLTKEERQEWENSVFKRPIYCHICKRGQPLRPGGFVIDHDHLTGRVIGLAHNVCNLKRSEKMRIPVLAHNLQGYDLHFILRNLHKVSESID